MISTEYCARKSVCTSFIPPLLVEEGKRREETRQQGDKAKCSDEMRRGDGYLGRVVGVMTRR